MATAPGSATLVEDMQCRPLGSNESNRDIADAGVVDGATAVVDGATDVGGLLEDPSVVLDVVVDAGDAGDAVPPAEPGCRGRYRAASTAPPIRTTTAASTPAMIQPVWLRRAVGCCGPAGTP